MIHALLQGITDNRHSSADTRPCLRRADSRRGKCYVGSGSLHTLAGRAWPLLLFSAQHDTVCLWCTSVRCAVDPWCPRVPAEDQEMAGLGSINLHYPEEMTAPTSRGPNPKSTVGAS